MLLRHRSISPILSTRLVPSYNAPRLYPPLFSQHNLAVTPTPPSSSTPSTATTTPRDRSLLCILLVTVFIIFSPLSFHDYTHWDDWHNIFGNPRMIAPLGETLAHYWTHPYLGLYIPVTYTVWALIAQLAYTRTPDPAGSLLNPWLFHTFNIFIHLLNTFLVYRIIQRCIPESSSESSPESSPKSSLTSLQNPSTRSSSHLRYVAPLAAALWALHPMQVETVAWICGSKDLLCWLGVLVASLLYLRHIDLHHLHDTTSSTQPSNLPDDRSHRSSSLMRFWLSPRYLGVAGIMILAILSKPTAMILPAVLGIFDHFFRRSAPIDRSSTSSSFAAIRTSFTRAALRVAPLLLITLAAMIVTKRVQPAYTVYRPAPPERLLVASDAITHYAIKYVVPLNLGFDYGRHPEYVLRESSRTPFTPLIPIALLGISLWSWHRRPVITGAIALAIVGVSPILGFVPFSFQLYSTVGDHYVYFSLLGPALLVAFLLARLPVSRFVPFAVASLLIIAFWSVQSLRQTGVWKTNESLNRHMIAVNPKSFGAYNNLGMAYSDRQDFVSAERMFSEVIRLRPDVVLGYTNRALARLKPTTLNLEGAAADLKKAIQLNQQGDIPRRDYLVYEILYARVLSDLNQPEAAEAIARELTAEFPNESGVIELNIVLRDRRLSQP